MSRPSAGEPQSLAAGATLTNTTRLFAGAKTVPLLTRYEYGGKPVVWWEFWNRPASVIPSFDKAVDWGMFCDHHPADLQHPGDLLRSWWATSAWPSCC